jgi:hypothetical protein
MARPCGQELLSSTGVNGWAFARRRLDYVPHPTSDGRI